MRQLQDFTVSEYLALDRASERKFEYIDGALRLLAGGSGNHSLVALNLAAMLRELLRSQVCRVFNSDMRVKLSSKRYVYPDLTITCDPRQQLDDDTVHAPLVVFEVLSPSTEQCDKTEKRRYYKAVESIQEVILVHTRAQFVEVHQRSQQEPALWVYRAFAFGEHVVLASLHVTFSVAAVYEQTAVPEVQPAAQQDK